LRPPRRISGPINTDTRDSRMIAKNACDRLSAGRHPARYLPGDRSWFGEDGRPWRSGGSKGTLTEARRAGRCPTDLERLSRRFVVVALPADLIDVEPERSTNMDLVRIEIAVREILAAVRGDPDREGLKRTPQRVARMKPLHDGLSRDWLDAALARREPLFRAAPTGMRPMPPRVDGHPTHRRLCPTGWGRHRI